MPPDRYLIVPADERWTVQFGDTVLSTFTKKGEAIEAAIVVACSSGKFGRQAQVLTKSEDGRFVPIWTYGQDSYSAKA
jgi:hypothetical protein